MISSAMPGESGCGGGGFAGAEDADDGKPVACGQRGGLDGVAIAGGAVEGREIAVGTDGRGEDAVDDFEQRELLDAGRRCGGEALGLLRDERAASA